VLSWANSWGLACWSAALIALRPFSRSLSERVDPPSLSSAANRLGSACCRALEICVSCCCDTAGVALDAEPEPAASACASRPRACSSSGARYGGVVAGAGEALGAAAVDALSAGAAGMSVTGTVVAPGWPPWSSSSSAWRASALNAALSLAVVLSEVLSPGAPAEVPRSDAYEETRLARLEEVSVICMRMLAWSVAATAGHGGRVMPQRVACTTDRRPRPKALSASIGCLGADLSTSCPRPARAREDHDDAADASRGDAAQL